MGRRALCLVLAALLALSTCGACLAATQASPTLAGYGVWAYTGDNSGELDIDYQVQANRTASSLGISVLEIYTGNGLYVDTIYGNTTNRLMANDLGVIDRTYTYHGTPGASYYAVATVEATIGNKYDSRITTTNIATTPWP